MRSALFIASLLVTASAVSPAWGADGLVTLKQIQVSAGARQVDLLFDGKVSANQIRTEFLNDVIQLSLMDTGVYPAKISSVNGGELTKIFAYQYTPRLVRARFTVKGAAASYKDRVVVIPNGKLLTIKFGTPGEIAAEKNAERAPERTIDKRTAAHPMALPERAQPFDPAEDKALLERVMKGSPAEAAPPAASERVAEAKAEAKREERKEDRKTTSSRPLGGAKPLPSPFAGLWKLALVLAAFGGIAYAGRKWMPGSLKNGLKAMRKKANLVEVISTQSLGPKKSIAVVRVSGTTLVLGVTNESINLISRLDGDADADLDDASLSELAINELTGKGNSRATAAPTVASAPRISTSPAPEIRISASGATAASGATTSPDGAVTISRTPTIRTGFAEYLRQADATAAPTSPAFAPSLPAASAPTSDVRNRIRSRLEGLKPL